MSIAASIFIMPHERHDAVEAYQNRLTPEQIEEINDAPEEAIINLQFGINAPETKITIIEEG